MLSVNLRLDFWESANCLKSPCLLQCVYGVYIRRPYPTNCASGQVSLCICPDFYILWGHNLKTNERETQTSCHIEYVTPVIQESIIQLYPHPTRPCSLPFGLLHTSSHIPTGFQHSFVCRQYFPWCISSHLEEKHLVITDCEAISIYPSFFLSAKTLGYWGKHSTRPKYREI